MYLINADNLSFKAFRRSCSLPDYHATSRDNSRGGKTICRRVLKGLGFLPCQPPSVRAARLDSRLHQSVINKALRSPRLIFDQCRNCLISKSNTVILQPFSVAPPSPVLYCSRTLPREAPKRNSRTMILDYFYRVFAPLGSVGLLYVSRNLLYARVYATRIRAAGIRVPT